MTGFRPKRLLTLCRVTLCCVFTALLAPAGALADHDDLTLQLLVQIRNPEIVTQHPDGNISVDNPATRLVETVVTEAGIDYEILLYPWARIMQELYARANVLAFPIARTPARESDLHWVGMIRSMDMNLYGLSERISELPQTLDEARESEIGVIRGDFVDQYLDNKGFTQLIRLTSLDNALTLLDRNRFALFPFESRGVEKMLRQRNLPDDYLLQVIDLPEASTEIFFAVSKQTDSHIKELLDLAYRRVVEDGRYQQIMGIEHDTRFTQ